MFSLSRRTSRQCQPSPYHTTAPRQTRIQLGTNRKVERTASDYTTEPTIAGP